MSDLREGSLVELIGPHAYGHAYIQDNRNPDYVHPFPSVKTVILPPVPRRALGLHLTGMVIKNLPFARGWHQASEIDYVVLVGDEFLVIGDCYLRELKMEADNEIV